MIWVIGAGDLGSPARLKKKWAAIRGRKRVIAVDGGYDACRLLGITPDLLLGDFDSLSPAQLQDALGKKIPIQRFSKDKNESDLRLALSVAQRWSRQDKGGVVCLGVTGGREDHHHAALFDITSFACRSRYSWQIWGACSDWYFLNSKVSVTLNVARRQTVSIFAMTGAVRGLQTKGLKWDGTQVKLLRPGSRGLSNLTAGKRIHVRIQSGCAVVVLPLKQV